jgi:hypothetical protein
MAQRASMAGTRYFFIAYSFWMIWCKLGSGLGLAGFLVFVFAFRFFRLFRGGGFGRW